MHVTHVLLMLCQDNGNNQTMPSQYWSHCKGKRAGRYSTAQPTVGADTHTQHLISHLESACVVDSELAGLRAILFHNGPLPKLDFLISTTAHQATAVVQHISAAAPNEKANGQEQCSKCLQYHACF